jgi:hypothetical protein
VVTFQRPGDAALAREKYDGKIVDGRESRSLSSSAASIWIIGGIGLTFPDFCIIRTAHQD